MRRPLVAGNWKMNTDRATAEALLARILTTAAGLEGVDVLVCPPSPYLDLASRALAGSSVALGAQDVSEHGQGAYTGEVSGTMLRDLGCSFTLVGHSERRAMHGEDDVTVARKFVAARQAGLVPVLCVGETLEEREAGRTDAVILRQLEAVIEAAGPGGFAAAVVAYEPVWAIGTGKTATPEAAQAVHALIREKISGLDATMASALRILYGGSVKASNAASLFDMPDIDGGLVGGASLDGDEFDGICQAASRVGLETEK